MADQPKKKESLLKKLKMIEAQQGEDARRNPQFIDKQVDDVDKSDTEFMDRPEMGWGGQSERMIREYLGHDPDQLQYSPPQRKSYAFMLDKLNNEPDSPEVTSFIEWANKNKEKYPNAPFALSAVPAGYDALNTTADVKVQRPIKNKKVIFDY